MLMPTNQGYPTKAALEAAFQIVRKARIPQMPDVILALREEIAREEPDTGVVSKLVSSDIAIAGQLLKTINSPAFSPRVPVASVQQAISMMGMKRLANLVTAEAVGRLVGETDGSVRVVWESIMEEARATAAVASLVRSVSEDEAYLFGIMHEVGCLIFAKASQAYAAEWILRSNSSPRLLLDFEQSRAGADHATIGFLLARHWQLPEHIALATYHHHTPGYLAGIDTSVRQLVAVSKLAHCLVAKSNGMQEEGEMMSYREDAWQELAISDDDWDSLNAQAEQGAWKS